MAKHIRSIKADLCDDETLGEVSRDARYLFVGLITRVDDHGRFRANPALLRSRVYPYDAEVTNEDVGRWLAELVAKGRVETYVADGQQYLVVSKWGKHQRIDNAAKSELPPPPEPGSPQESTSPPQSAATRGDSPLEGNGREWKGREGNGSVELALMSPPVTGEDRVERIFDAWKTHTGHHGAVLTRDRRAVILRGLKQYPVEDLLDACSGVLLSPHHRGENERHTVYDDIELVLRNAKNIEMFRDLARGVGGPAPPKLPQNAESVRRAVQSVGGAR